MRILQPRGLADAVRTSTSGCSATSRRERLAKSPTPQSTTFFGLIGRPAVAPIPDLHLLGCHELWGQAALDLGLPLGAHGITHPRPARSWPASLVRDDRHQGPSCARPGCWTPVHRPGFACRSTNLCLSSVDTRTASGCCAWPWRATRDRRMKCRGGEEECVLHGWHFDLKSR